MRCRSISRLFLWRTLFRVRLAGLGRLRPAQFQMRLDCLGDKCAKCCSTMGGDIVVAGSEVSRLPVDATYRNRKVIFIKSSNGVCSLLEHGKCTVYDARPSGCREYPWYNMDERLYYDSGCPGIKFDRDERPSTRDIVPIETYFNVGAISRYAIFWLMRHW